MNEFTSLVTGGAGFIGSNLVDALIEKGHRVIVIDNLSTGKKQNLNSEAEFYNSDLNNLQAIKPLFQGVDFVFHLAAVPRIMISIQDPISSHKNNLTATIKVLTATKDVKIKKVVYASSTSIYGNQSVSPITEDLKPCPLNPYGVQKYGGELYCRAFSEVYNLPTVCLRYFNVFGPRQSFEGDYACVSGIFLRQKKAGEPLTIVGDGKQRRDFTYVKDVVRATILAAESKVVNGDAINIASGNNYSINELADIIGGERRYIPARPGEIKESLGDISKAKQLLGWEPKYNLELGLKDMMKD